MGDSGGILKLLVLIADRLKSFPFHLSVLAELCYQGSLSLVAASAVCLLKQQTADMVPFF